MSFTGVDLGAFYQKTVPLSRSDSGLLQENSMVVARRTKSSCAKFGKPLPEQEEKSLEQLLIELTKDGELDWGKLGDRRQQRD
jgi:hypothetical protein